MDGWITIGTKLDTSKFDKQISDLKAKIQKEENNKLEIESNLKEQAEFLEGYSNVYDALIEGVKEYEEELARLDAEIESFPRDENGFLINQSDVDYVNELQDKWQETNAEVQGFYTAIKNSEQGIQSTVEKMEKLKEQHDSVVAKIDEYNRKIAQTIALFF